MNKMNWKTKLVDDLQKSTPTIIPIISKDMWSFVIKDIPMLGNTQRNIDLIPYWRDIYQDTHKNKIIRAGRQTGKTTYLADKMIFYGVTNPSKEITYVADNEAHKSAFSKDRLTRDCIRANKKITQCLPFESRTSVDTVELTTGVTIHLCTDQAEYKNVEGKSNIYLAFDETQYHDLEFASKAMSTLTATHGSFETVGIGGEEGSPWDDRWTKSDQNHWIYNDITDYKDPSTGRIWENQGWRNNLTFDKDGNFTNSSKELSSILSGKHIKQNPNVTENSIRGYWIPQSICPHIPLTIHDAVTKYNAPKEVSIEWQERNNPTSIFVSHCMALSYKAERRPITPEILYNCMRPYQYMSLLTPGEVKELKTKYNDEILICGGVDFGSSTKLPTTVLAIMIFWKKSNRWLLAHIEKIAQTDHSYDKARHISQTLESYSIDAGVGDIGHAQDMIPMIQNGGRDSNDVKFNGLGKDNFIACRSTGDNIASDVLKRGNVSNLSKSENTILRNKTEMIQELIDMLGTKVPTNDIKDPSLSPDANGTLIPALMIPYKNDLEVDFIIHEWVKLTRKDLNRTQEGELNDARQNVKKEFNHPPDSMMAVIYCMVAKANYQRIAPYHGAIIRAKR